LLHINYHNNVFISLKTLSNETFRLIKNKFTHTYETWENRKKVTKTYKFLYRDKYLYKGLLSELIDFCLSVGISFVLDDKLKTRNKFTDEQYDKLIEVVKPSLTPRFFQKDSIMKVIRNKQQTVLSCTSSGKSLIIYILIMFFKLIRKDKSKKSLIIVPSINLVNQIYGNFIEYAETNDKIIIGKLVRKLNSEQEKFDEFDESCLLTTWQSLQNKPSSFLDQFEMVLVDECHGAKSPVLKKKILEKCINAEYKSGVTGTMPLDDLNSKVITGLLGKLTYSVSQRELINMGFAPDIEIKSLILNYPKVYQKMNYQDECYFVNQNDKKKKVITQIIEKYDKQNVLCLFKLIKYGKSIVRILKKKFPNKNIMYIDGSILTKSREEIKKTLEENVDCILVASYRVFSTGESVKNIHTSIFTESPGIKNYTCIQSIGRLMRKHESKDKATVWEIVDKIEYNNNYSPYGYLYNHYIKRKDFYEMEQHPVYEKEIKT